MSHKLRYKLVIVAWKKLQASEGVWVLLRPLFVLWWGIMKVVAL